MTDIEPPTTDTPSRALSVEKERTVIGRHGQGVRVRHDEWYGEWLVEIQPNKASKGYGGQVLLTPEQAVDLIAVLSEVIADAKEASRG